MSNVNLNTGDASTIAKLNKELQSLNHLTSDDLKTLSYQKLTLIVGGGPVQLRVTSTVAGKAASKELTVTLSKIPIVNILDKIKNTNYTISYLNSPQLNNSSTVNAIKKAIRQTNSNSFDNSQNITVSELPFLNIAGSNLKSGAPVTLTVSEKGKPGTKSITVTLSKYASYNHILAPFIDMGSLPQNPHVSNLVKFQQDSLLNNFMLAFIQQKGSSVGKEMDPAWFGTVSVFDPQTPAEKAALTQVNNGIVGVEKAGGHVGISFGGQAGTAPWAPQAGFTPTPTQISDMLLKIVNLYKINWLDFDIEGSELQDVTGLGNLGKALNIVEGKLPKMKISLTIAADAAEAAGINPTFPKAYTALGSALDKMPIINIMAMDFGASWGTKNMSMGAQKAAKAVADETAKLWSQSKFGVDGTKLLTEYMGITVMIGNNDVNPQVFSKQNAESLGVWARKTGIRWLGWWSGNRDFASPKPALGNVSITNTGTYQQPYDYNNIFLSTFGDSTMKHGPLSGKVIVTDYNQNENVLGFEWNPIENAAMYKVYINESYIATTTSSGYYGYNTAYIAGSKWSVKVVAIGSEGTLASQPLEITIPTPASKQLTVTGPAVLFSPTKTYSTNNNKFIKTHQYLIGDYRGTWTIFKQMWYLNPNTLNDDVAAKAIVKVGTVAELSNMYSNKLLQDLTANKALPSWYPANFDSI